MADGIIDGEIPKRVKYSGGKLVPEFPEECEPHTKTPSGYGAFSDWCETMSETHVQRQCLGCGLYAVWEPRLQPTPGIQIPPEGGTFPVDGMGVIGADGEPVKGTVTFTPVVSIVHCCPPDGTFVTPCCGESPFDLPRTDRITEDPLLVTCAREEA